MSRTPLSTPAQVLVRVREIEAAKWALDAELLELAAQWADAHPDPAETAAAVPGPGAAVYGASGVSWLEALVPVTEDEADTDPLIPGMAWDAGASFAAALGRSTAAGERLIRDALVLRHRLPRVWGRVQAGQVEAWRARRVAQAVFTQPADVAPVVDCEVAPVAQSIGPVRLERVVEAALMRLHPEEHELARAEALEARYVRLEERGLDHTGIAELVVRGEWADLHAFDTTVGQVAAVLKTRAVAVGEFVDPLEVRRARAVGILADPETAAALLAGDPHAPTAPRRQVELVIHLSPDQLVAGDPVARLLGSGAGAGRPVPADLVRTWCGNPGAKVTVRPVLDLAQEHTTGAYEATATQRRQVGHLAGEHCTFPWCERPATSCDLDHLTPHHKDHPDQPPDPPGPHSTGPGATTWPGATTTSNLQPLCRRHHRLKTHAGWQVTAIEPGVWHWTDPHGHPYRRDPTGTTELTPRPPPRHAVPWETPLPRTA